MGPWVFAFAVAGISHRRGCVDEFADRVVLAARKRAA
jgi:hypothetical protein